MQDQEHIPLSKLSSVTPQLHDVILFGHDPSLLSYRAQVIQRAGFNPISMRLESDLVSTHAAIARVVVLCHTLTASERQMLTQCLRVQAPSTRILALDAANIPAEEIRRYDALLESLCGPVALVEKIRSLSALSGNL